MKNRYSSLLGLFVIVSVLFSCQARYGYRSKVRVSPAPTVTVHKQVPVIIDTTEEASATPTYQVIKPVENDSNEAASAIAPLSKEPVDRSKTIQGSSVAAAKEKNASTKSTTGIGGGIGMSDTGRLAITAGTVFVAGPIFMIMGMYAEMQTNQFGMHPTSPFTTIGAILLGIGLVTLLVLLCIWIVQEG